MSKAQRPPVPYIMTVAEVIAMEKAGRIVADTFNAVKGYMKPGVSTLEIDKIAEDYILSQNAKPAFKGYKVDGRVFPNALCISINDEIVHGIPNANRKLKDGDIVSVDCGAEFEGYFGDSAVTYAIGEVSEECKKLMRVTEESLFKGIEQAVDGNKLYEISKAVQEYVEAYGFSVTRELVGHGIGKRLHEEPPVPNFVPPLLQRKYYPNITLKKNMAIAIEPMVHAGKRFVRALSDGWTYVTADGSPAAHFEHTVIIDCGKAKILTLRD
jgi:methionyl aminopeptidase